MIYKRTTIEKFTKAIKALEARGGVVIVDGIDIDETKDNPRVVMTGRANLRIAGFDMSMNFYYEHGEASFKITKKPFFITDDQIAQHLFAALE